MALPITRTGPLIFCLIILVSFCNVDFLVVKNWPLCVCLIPHQQMLFEYIQTYQLFTESSGQMLNQAGDYLKLQGKYREAEPLYKEALKIYKQTLGEKNWRYEMVFTNLRSLYTTKRK
jgi:tetratricopeptide (TPR) repeat protein